MVPHAGAWHRRLFLLRPGIFYGIQDLDSPNLIFASLCVRYHGEFLRRLIVALEHHLGVHSYNFGLVHFESL